MVTNARELINDVNFGDSLGCSEHTLVEFTVLRDMGKARSIVRTLNFRKASFQLFQELVSRTLWEVVFRDRGAEQSWQRPAGQDEHQGRTAQAVEAGTAIPGRA